MTSINKDPATVQALTPKLSKNFMTKMTNICKIYRRDKQNISYINAK